MEGWKCNQLTYLLSQSDYCGKGAVFQTFFLNTFNTLKFSHIHKKIVEYSDAISVLLEFSGAELWRFEIGL